MSRNILAVVLALLAGALGVFLVESLSAFIYPPPADLDVADKEALAGFVEKLPTGALVLILVAHALGSLAGGVVCALVARRVWYGGAAIVGVLLLAAGVANLVMIPHPTWFSIIDVLLYVPLALLGCALAGAVLPPRKVSAAA